MQKGYALVTGASSGIGAAMAEILHARGYPLILVARRTERLEQLKADMRRKGGADVVIIAQDLSTEGAGMHLFSKVAEKNLQVDVLINNAGYGMQGRFLDMKMDEMERMFRLNMHTLTELTLLFSRSMAKRGQGYILNVASAAALLPSPYVSAYAATKAYVMSFSEALRYELKDAGVSVTTLYPGITRTEFNEVAHAKHPPMMEMSVLSAEAVARAGLNAMFARRRVIVPGLINKINAFLCHKLNRGIVTRMAGYLLRKANGW